MTVSSYGQSGVNSNMASSANKDKSLQNSKPQSQEMADQIKQQQRVEDQKGKQSQTNSAVLGVGVNINTVA